MRWDYLGIFGGLLKRKRNSKILIPKTECTNCKHSQELPFKFCPNCGQSTRESKITFWSLLSEVFSNIFNLDASLYRSFFWLPVPAYLSKKYVKGERKQFLNPVRFFFFSMLVFFALLVGFIDMDALKQSNNEQLMTIERSLLLDSFNNEINKPLYANLDSAQILGLKNSLFNGVVPSNQDTVLDVGLDTMDVISFSHGIKLLRKDLFNKPIDEILQENQDASWSSRLMMGQMIRVVRNISGATNFFVGNGIWVFVAGIFLLSFVMKTIYLRKKRFFIEHSIILFHTHAFAFVVGTICMLVYKFGFKDPSIFLVGLVLSVLYVLLSMKRYYGQGWIKTIIKLIIITFFYFMIMAILVSIVLLLSIILFN